MVKCGLVDLGEDLNIEFTIVNTSEKPVIVNNNTVLATYKPLEYDADFKLQELSKMSIFQPDYMSNLTLASKTTKHENSSC